MRWRREGSDGKEQRRQMATAARGFPEMIPTVAIIVETERKKNTKSVRCNEQTGISSLLSAFFSE